MILSVGRIVLYPLRPRLWEHNTKLLLSLLTAVESFCLLRMTYSRDTVNLQDRLSYEPLACTIVRLSVDRGA